MTSYSTHKIGQKILNATLVIKFNSYKYTAKTMKGISLMLLSLKFKRHKVILSEMKPLLKQITFHTEHEIVWLKKNALTERIILLFLF